MGRSGPQVGQIVRFDYLWCDKAETGQRQGAKDRPCAMVVARRNDKDGREIVLLAPISHTPPVADAGAIVIPVGSSRTTGLDNEQSWLVISEVNLADWSDPGFVPISQGRWLYGHLPRQVAEQAVAAIRAKLLLGRMPITERK